MVQCSTVCEKHVAFLMSRLPVIAADILVLLLTWRTNWAAYRLAKELKLPRAWSALLIRNGEILYYGVNLLLHAEPAADGSPGGAVWDLFRAEDADTVRRFLARRAGEKGTDKDPLLAGAMYVDDEMRRVLWTEHGIASHRLVQRAGDAVFIPAGVAHQVANAADCIKVAVDFVSPEGVGRCEELMRACRAQNQGPAWHEEGLRLREMMWYAWVNCARMEESKAEGCK